MDYFAESLRLHELHQGKLEVSSRMPVNSLDDLSLAYTPGVAEPCKEIAKDVTKARTLTMKGRTVAVVTDGSAVLGLGNIGPEAALPVMEGKCALFKAFGDVDAVPICLNTRDTDKIIEAVQRIAPTFGGINLEDIAAPRCFEIEAALREKLDIPVFHDDQHGTAIVVAAAVINSYRLLGRELADVKTVINGAGAAGIAIAKMLLAIGIKDIVICDSKGAIHSVREGLSDEKRELAVLLKETRGYGFSSDVQTLADAVVGRDLFIGVSAPNVLTTDDIKKMNADSVIFAMSNPIPEIMPADAAAGGARIIGTGRSDFPNQINNVLVFPGIFAGALRARATDITDRMKLAAVYALADFIPQDKLNESYVVPAPFDEGVAERIAKEVAAAAK